MGVGISKPLLVVVVGVDLCALEVCVGISKPKLVVVNGVDLCALEVVVVDVVGVVVLVVVVEIGFMVTPEAVVIFFAGSVVVDSDSGFNGDGVVAVVVVVVAVVVAVVGVVVGVVVAVVGVVVAVVGDVVCVVVAVVGVLVVVVSLGCLRENTKGSLDCVTVGKSGGGGGGGGGRRRNMKDTDGLGDLYGVPTPVFSPIGFYLGFSFLV